MEAQAAEEEEENVAVLVMLILDLILEDLVDLLMEAQEEADRAGQIRQKELTKQL
jgi:hypothetical protein